MNKVLLLTGSGGSGKTTISELLESKYGWARIDGDQLDTEFFPHNGQWLPENTDNLALAHDKILRETRRVYDTGRNVVVDYIIFGRYVECIEKFRKEFGDAFEVVVLYPSKDETVMRDLARECWTTGEQRIIEVRTEFEAVKAQIGADHFIDTTGEAPEATIEKHFNNLLK